MYKTTLRSKNYDNSSESDSIEGLSGGLHPIFRAIKFASRNVVDILDGEYFRRLSVINSKLTDLELISEELRRLHIETVNSYQDRILGDYDYHISHVLCNPMHRKLVLYYRGTQMSMASRRLARNILYLLRAYVNGGYSKLFDTFLIVYRENDEDYLREFRDNSMLLSGKHFEIVSALYANTVHLSDGTPNFLPGTVPILGNTPFLRWKKMYQEARDARRSFGYKGELPFCNERYTRLPITLINTNERHTTHSDLQNNPVDWGSTVIRSVRKCEDKTIRLAQEYGKKHG